MLKRIAILIVFLFSSCAYQLDPLEKEARTLYYHNISNVLVVPFIDHTNTPGLSQEVTDTFTAELARFSEVGVIHSASVYDYLEKNRIVINEGNLLEVGLELGDIFGVEAILIGVVTEFETYYPPILGLSVELINRKSGESLYAVSETYDSNLNFVRVNLKKYAGSRKSTDSVFGDEVILRKRSLFIQFVTHEIIRKNL